MTNISPEAFLWIIIWLQLMFIFFLYERLIYISRKMSELQWINKWKYFEKKENQVTNFKTWEVTFKNK